MISHLVTDASGDAIPIWPVGEDGFEGWCAARPEPVRAWVQATGFRPARFKHLCVPAADGALAGIILGLGTDQDEAPDNPWAYAGLPGDLPPGAYRIDAALGSRAATLAALGWVLGTYRYRRYKSDAPGTEPATLVAPEAADIDYVTRTASAIVLVRDLINTPSGDMGPEQLATAAQDLGHAHGADFRIIEGARLAKDFPAIYAVGKGSPRAPRLIDLRWGEPDAPRLTVVGKGVCFDSGGLDIKPAAGMRLMKKDMGGAAHALGLARMVMAAGLDVRLRVLIPAVENSVSGAAYRPGDVIATRKGVQVEIGNTDAEGRLVLADALALADEEAPDLLIDLATLTGAARVALGTDLPALFTDDDAVADALADAGRNDGDPLWRLPLWTPYAQGLDSKIADIGNITQNGGFAGAITAALFLKRFVDKAAVWAHLDIYGWNRESRPGRPAGGEAMALRALFAVIRDRFAAGAKNTGGSG